MQHDTKIFCISLLLSNSCHNYCQHSSAYKSHPSSFILILHTYSWSINFVLVLSFVPSVLWRCWLGGRKGIRPVKTEWWGAGMVICLQRGADLHMAQLMPLPLTVSCFNKSQIGFTFLLPSHPGSHGQRAVKRVCCLLYIKTFYFPATPLTRWQRLYCETMHKMAAKSTTMHAIQSRLLQLNTL